MLFSAFTGGAITQTNPILNMSLNAPEVILQYSTEEPNPTSTKTFQAFHHLVLRLRVYIEVVLQSIIFVFKPVCFCSAGEVQHKDVNQ